LLLRVQPVPSWTARSSGFRSDVKSPSKIKKPSAIRTHISADAPLAYGAWLVRFDNGPEFIAAAVADWWSTATSSARNDASDATTPSVEPSR
jgi:hypothetical protein